MTRPESTAAPDPAESDPAGSAVGGSAAVRREAETLDETPAEADGAEADGAEADGAEADGAAPPALAAPPLRGTWRQRVPGRYRSRALEPAAWKLVGISALAGLAVLAAPPPVAIPAGLALAFVLPGAALCRLIFADRPPPWAERLVLVPALSLAVLVIGGLLLHVVGLRLERASWLGLTVGVVLVATLGAHWRSRPSATGTPFDEPPPDAEPAPATVSASESPSASLSASGGPSPAVGVPAADRVVRRVVRRGAAAVQGVGALVLRLLSGRPHRTSVLRVAPLALAVVLLAAAGWLSLHSALRGSADTVTALSVVPARVQTMGTRKLEVAVTGIATGDRFQVQITTADYRRVLPVTSGERWTTRVTVPDGDQVTIGLYRVGDAAAYRTVSIGAASGVDPVSGVAVPQ